MCVLFIAKDVSKQYPLIIIANRDEFYARAAAPISRWPNSAIIGGQDLQESGTWLGITAAGKIAALTNIRDPKSLRQDVKSRGHLVTDFLNSNASYNETLAHLTATSSLYNGYNLLFGNRDELGVFHSATQTFTTIESGVYGLSNAQLNTPWPKIVRGKQMLNEYLSTQTSIDPISLAEILQNTQQAPDKELPQTGVPLEIERMLSPLFIQNKDSAYGTRCTSVLLFNGQGNIDFHEISYNEQGMLAASNLLQV